MIAPRIVLVTDPAFGDDAIVACVEAAAGALPAGALCVQLRDKRRTLPSLRVFASRLRMVTRAVGAWLVINGDARLARDVGADGVHLGRGAGTVREARDAMGRDAWVTIAAHTDDAVRAGLDDGADAALVSPIFATRPPSPLAGAKTPRGVEAIRSARAIARRRMRLYALGGVTAENARACTEAGADGAAVIRALLRTHDAARSARELLAALSAAM